MEEDTDIPPGDILARFRERTLTQEHEVLTTTFGQSYLFNLEKVLDMQRAGGRRRPTKKYHVTYAPEKGPPHALGEWSDTISDFANREFSGRWIKEPIEDQSLLLKILPNETVEQAIELDALIRTNDLFGEDEAARPTRLFGFGESFSNAGEGYLITEFVGADFQQLKNYVLDREHCTPQEIIDISRKLTTVLETLHSNGMTHSDVEGVGVFDHVYWNPKSKQLRLIDFGNSQIKGTSESPNQHDYTHDHAGIGHLLLGGLTGVTSANMTTHSRLLQSSYPPEVCKDVLDIVGKATGRFDGEEVAGYPRSAEGTVALRQDLIDFKTKWDSLPT